jgi:hypothetical protein
MFRFKNDSLVTVRSLHFDTIYLLSVAYKRLQSFTLPVYSADMHFVSGNATAAVQRYTNTYVRANRGYFEHLL